MPTGAFGARGDRRRVRAGMRLGEAERAEQLALRERRQEFLLLRLVAVAL